MKADISVLMSVYYKEKPEYMRQCFESLLHQTLQANEWVIVEDGKLTDELYAVLDEYEKKYPGLIKRVPLEQNVGLGLALRSGVPECSNELIARMDTDDIARKDRFAKEYAFMQENPDLDICGSYHKEFIDDLSNIVAVRRVPLNNEDIIAYQKKRSAYNHVTVMFKKSSVLRAGNYENCPLMEDDMLWTRMILAGCKGKNIPENLVYVRVGKDMYERRGGLAYYRKYKKGRKEILDTGFINRKQYAETVAVQFIVCIIPNGVRKFVFNHFLRG